VLAVTSGALMLGNIAFKLNSPLTQRTLVALLVVWLIAYFVVRGEKKGVVLNALFTNKILIFIGKMSYGIYLYHLTVLYCSYPVLNWLNSYLPFYERHAYGYWLVETQLIIVALAWGSWKYVESPLHALGKRLVEKKPIPSSAAPASS
jgi:peptidoglycan/LPS O-acetylase OafA/YrhL